MLLWFFQKFLVVENQGDRELYTYKTLKMFYSCSSEISAMQPCTSYYKQINHFPCIQLMAHLCDFPSAHGCTLACQHKAMVLLKYTDAVIIYLSCAYNMPAMFFSV